jgi:lysophospholipase L1-like esterase
LSGKKSVLLLGDSLIEYGQWENYLSPHHVINYGLAGETVEGLLERLAGILKEDIGVDFCVLMTGINNVAMEDYSFLPAYREILSMLKKRCPGSKIIVCSLLPVMLEWVDNARTEEINNKLADLCSEMGVHYLDLYSSFVQYDEHPRAEYLLEDGVHLSEEGYRLWAKLLLEVINET